MIKINGRKPARKSKIKCGDNTISHRLTTDGTTGTARISIEDSSNSGHLIPVMWISETRDGPPIKVMYGPPGKRKNAAVAKGAGQEIPLTTKPSRRHADVRLEHGKIYWLCHELRAKRGGAEPTASSSFIRSCSISDGGGV